MNDRISYQPQPLEPSSRGPCPPPRGFCRLRRGLRRRLRRESARSGPRPLRGGRRTAARLVLLCLTAVWAAAVVGCELASEGREVEIVLPPVPASLVGEEPAYRLEWIDGSGRERRTAVFPPTRRVAVDLLCRPGTPVLAYPVVAGHVDFARPAGGVFPDSVGPGERMALSWQDGFLAERYRRLIDRGVRVEAVNTPKLMRRIEIVAGSDPWGLDPVRLEREIADRTLSAASVTRLPRREVSLPLPPGVWIQENLLAPSLTADEADGDDAVARVSASLGYHRLVEAETGRMVSFFVPESEAQPAAMVTTWPRY